MRAPSTSVFFSEMDEYQNSPRRRGWISRWSRRIGSLSRDVFERRTSTGSELFSLLVCLDANKFVLLSFFSPLKTIYSRVSTKPLPNDAKSSLPVDVRRSKTLLLKFPNDYEREIFVAGVHAWHLTKIARAYGLIRGQSGTSFWKRFCTWVLRMCSARWSKNMADEEDDDPVVAEVCLSHDCEDLCTV